MRSSHTARGFGRVALPFALDRKFPSAPSEWKWQFVFPATRICRDPGWNHTPINCLRASCFVGAPWIRASMDAYPPLSAVWRKVAVMAFARNRVVRRAGLVLKSLFIHWFTILNDGPTRLRLPSDFEGY